MQTVRKILKICALYLCTWAVVAGTSHAEGVAISIESGNMGGNAANSTPYEDTGKGAAAPDLSLPQTMSVRSAGGGTPQFVTRQDSVLSPKTSLVDGAASFSVPIDLPPGRAGMVPKLALNYNSKMQNGIVGVGWNLDVMSIQRSTKYGVNYNANDFVVNGSEELTPRPVWGAGFYGAKIESAYTKYEFLGATQGWIATTREGIKYHYGRSSASRQANAGSQVFKWLIDKVEDTYGNYMTYHYFKDSYEVYLESVRYTGNSSNGGLLPSNSVTFAYEYRDASKDSPSRNTILSLVKTRKRLKSIVARCGDDLFRRYALSYEYGPSTHRSRLKEVAIFGSDNSSRLPPYKFDYAHEVNDWSTEALFYEDTGGWPDDPKGFMNMADVDGDGRTDLIVNNTRGVVYTYLSDDYLIGDGNDFTTTGGNGGNGKGLVKFADINRDGKADLLKLDNTGKVYSHLSDGDGTYTYKGVHSRGSGGKNGWIKFADTNGDGRSDLHKIYLSNSTAYVETYLANGNGTFSSSMAGGGPVHGPTGSGQFLGLVNFGDVNGDGRADLVLHKANGYFYTFLAGANGSFSSYRSTTRSLNLLEVCMIDINGDGLRDVVHKIMDSSSNVDVVGVCSEGNGTFKTTDWRLLGADGPNTSDASHILVADVNGTGTFTVVNWTNPYSDTMYLADITGNRHLDIVFPYNGGAVVMFKEDNTLPDHVRRDATPADYLETVYHGTDTLLDKKGTTTTYAYKASSSYTNLYMPFVTHVVHSVSVNNGFSDTVTEYDYKNGLFDFDHREFKGFGTITQTLPDGSVEETWFHDRTGPVESAWVGQDWYFKGRPFSVVKKESAGSRPYEEVVNIWAKEPSCEGCEEYFVKMGSRSTVFDNAPETLFLKEEYDYYTYADHEEDGNNPPGSLRSTTITGTDIPTRTTEYLYETFGNQWLWKKRSEKLTGALNKEDLESPPVVVAETLYDWTYSGDAFTSVVQQRVNTGGNVPSPATQKLFDVFGNTVSDQSGHMSGSGFVAVKTVSTTFDAQKLFPAGVQLPATVNCDGETIAHNTSNSDFNYGTGKPKSVTDENGNLTRHTFDVFGRLTETRGYAGGDESNPLASRMETIYDYDSFPWNETSRVYETGTDRIVTKKYVDGLGRKIQMVARGKNGSHPYLITLFTYDAMGREKYTVGPFSAATDTFQASKYASLTGTDQTAMDGVLDGNLWTMKVYDRRGRIVKTEQSGGIEVTVNYNGFESTVTDPDAGLNANPDVYRKTEKRDALGNIIRITEHGANDQQTFYLYNSAGGLVSVRRTDPATGVQIENRITYNSLGQKTRMVDPDMGDWRYAYDPQGNLTRQSFFKEGMETEWMSMTYDPLSRIKSKSYHHVNPSPGFAEENPSVEYCYDKSSVANASGRLTSVSNETVTLRVSGYDSRGNITGEYKEITVDDNTTTAVLSYAYDMSGKLRQRAYPGDVTVGYHYHPGTSLLKSVTQGPAENSPLLASITGYSTSGKTKAMLFGNGVNTSYSYYADTDRLETLTTSKNGTLIQKYSYAYYPSGDIDTIVNQADPGNEVTRTYTYDPLHRLIGEATSPAAIQGTRSAESLIYSYDGSATGDSGVHNIKTIRHSGASQVLAYGYDAKGNLVSGPDFSTPGAPRTRTLTYNSKNMPLTVSLDNTLVSRYLYDGAGSRAAKIENGVKTLYFNDTYEITDQVKTIYIFAGNLRIARLTGEPGSLTTAYYHKDHLGSSVVMTGANGERIDPVNAEYLPYGLAREQGTALQTGYRFTDQEFDENAGLYNYDARLYDPVIGLFVTADSVVPETYNPQMLNRYAYCGNNPLVYTDPSGHFGVMGAALIIGSAMWFCDSIISPRKAIAPTPRTDFSQIHNPTWIDHATNYATVGTIAFTAAASGGRAAMKEIGDEVVSFATGGFTDVAKMGKVLKKSVASKSGSLNPAFQKGFSNHKELVKYLGPAGEGRAWHHIVEQTPANIKKFGPEKIHNVNNVVNLEHGGGKLHNKISGFYSSKAPGGGRIRDWQNTKSFEKQYDFGTRTLERFFYAE